MERNTSENNASTGKTNENRRLRLGKGSFMQMPKKTHVEIAKRHGKNQNSKSN